MRKHFTTMIITAAMTGTTVFSQGLYMLNLSDPASFSYTCGDVLPAKWSVKNNYCSIFTRTLTMPASPLQAWIAPVTVIIKSTGNLDCREFIPDGAFIRYSVDGGPWFTIAKLIGCDFDGQTIAVEKFFVPAYSGSTFVIRVDIATNSTTEKMWIEDKNIVVGVPLLNDPSNWIKKTGDPSPVTTAGSSGSFRIYPNPSINHQVYLDFGTDQEEIELVVYDLLGRIMIARTIAAHYGDPVLFEHNLAPGTYIVTGSGASILYKTTMVVK